MSLILLIVFALFVCYAFKNFKNKKPTDNGISEESTNPDHENKWQEWFEYREQMCKEYGPLPMKVRQDFNYAAQQLKYLINGMSYGNWESRVSFYLNVVEKIECMNPTVIKYMKSASCTSDVCDYENMKDLCEKHYHGSFQ